MEIVRIGLKANPETFKPAALKEAQPSHSTITLDRRPASAALGPGADTLSRGRRSRAQSGLGFRVAHGL